MLAAWGGSWVARFWMLNWLVLALMTKPFVLISPSATMACYQYVKFNLNLLWCNQILLKIQDVLHIALTGIP